MKILILEDDEVYLSLYSDFFRMKERVEIVTVSTVDSAFKWLDRHVFDIVITDIYIASEDSRLDGKDVIRKIISEGRKERIIVVSGSTGGTMTEYFNNAAVLRVFPKPFRLVELWACIKSIQVK